MAALTAVLSTAPSAVSIASVRSWSRESAATPLPKPKPGNRTPARPNSAAQAREVAIRLASGTVVATVSWTVDEEQSSDVLRGGIEYRPNADRPGSCSNIRFIQVAKAVKNGGINYDWEGMEERRNILRTSSQMGPGIRDGYFVDHKAFTCSPGGACSPYFRDHWANARESEDGYQLDGHTAPASLVDYPFGWDVLERISLESCARCVDTGQFLGCTEWGAGWPVHGPRTIAPIRVRQTPSKTFLAALQRFEKFYPTSGQWSVAGGQSKPLPVSRPLLPVSE
jgi:hypothetical protein